MAVSHLTAATAAALPSPQDRPQADVVIFDGQCRFCTAQVRRLAGWDSRGRLAYLSLHDPQVAERYPDLSHEQLMQAMVVVDPKGCRHIGADAIRRVSTQLPRLWCLAPLLNIPGSLPLWQFLYRQVAKRRYKIAGTCEDGTCRLHQH
jgi:predicted DCC family thiol-disulfide oxidoreductase YuxK